MKTTLDATTLLYQVLIAGPLKAAINGDVYKDTRGASNKEDVVINAPTIDSGDIQRSVCNVNIHLPALNTPDGPVPNHSRLAQLVNIAKNILQEGYAESHNYWIENQSLINDQAAKDWYYNFRIRVNFHKTN